MCTAIIILAAGSSSRLGKPKQTLIFRDKTLLDHVITEAIKASLHPVLIITGSHAESLTSLYKEKAAEWIYNPQWETGMASGIVLGISHLLMREIDSVIISVCDQPWITADLFGQLIHEKSLSKKGIIACSYAGTLGTPVLFDKIYFQKLQTLKGQEGAKKFIRSRISDVATVPFENGRIDIDTMQDYNKLIAGIQ